MPKQFPRFTLTTYEVALLILGFFIGVSVVEFYLTYEGVSAPTITALRQSDLNSDPQYKYIDPLIGLKGVGTNAGPQYNDLRQSLNNLITNEIEHKHITAASIAFRDIKGGAALTLNPDEKYSPASLLKVPTMIAYFKLEEKEPGTLSHVVTYEGGPDLNLEEHFRSPIQLEQGKSYTVEQLIQYMIRYSDNNAATLLVDHLNKTGHANFLNSLFKDLGIDEISLSDDFLTIQDYLIFFRVLYNSTYLSREMSEKALKLLTETDFSKGIGTGVPNSIQIAQKFGEFTVLDPKGMVIKKELHQCGFVYYPDHPYLLCVMTKGTDFEDLEPVLAQASRIIFEHMEVAYPRKN